MYRPRNWAQLLLKHMRERLDNNKGDLSIEWEMLNCAEAGADAYEEGLKKEAISPGRVGSYSFDKKDSLHVDLGWGFGYLVFIPDEEVKK